MNYPKTVEILLATYNGAKFIREQLDSIFSQSYPHFKVIARDDHSTDSTFKILREYAARYPEKMTIIKGNTQLGVKRNFSELMKHASGPYVMFCDQDDIWHADKIAVTFDKMEEAELQYGLHIPLLIHTDLAVVDAQGKVMSPSFWGYSGLYVEECQPLNRLITQNVVTGCTMMINRTLLKYAFPVPDFTVMHDWWIALVAGSLGHVIALPEATIDYRQHGKNTFGAKKMWSIDSLRRLFTPNPILETEKRLQAQELLHRYDHLLIPSYRKIIEAYIACEKASFIKRGFLIARYKLFKSGLLRNLVYLTVRS